MRLLETHGCQGGAHAGYVRAGWDVTGVDIDRRHARYYPGQLIIADAATYIREHGHEYDAIHASPPCQWYTRGNAKGRATGNSKWERTIPAIREALESTGRPYVIENVADAAWDMRDPVRLCGCMFGLSTIDTDGIRIHLKRERLFETNWGLTAPKPCNHDGIEWWAGAYGGARRDKYEAKYVRRGGYVPPDKDVVKALLGIEHEMTWNGLYECLPPAYTSWIGSQLAEHLFAPSAGVGAGRCGVTTCPCRYHRLRQHPRLSYVPAPGLVDLMDLCRCECNHAPDEERYVTTYPCDACDTDHRADRQPPAVDCDRSHCQESSETCRVCVSHARDEARN